MKELAEYCNSLKVRGGSLKYYPPKTQFDVNIHYGLNAVFHEPGSDVKSGIYSIISIVIRTQSTLMSESTYEIDSSNDKIIDIWYVFEFYKAKPDVPRIPPLKPARRPISDTLKQVTISFPEMKKETKKSAQSSDSDGPDSPGEYIYNWPHNNSNF